jgi:PAS domain S-box-containing protein
MWMNIRLHEFMLFKLCALMNHRGLPFLLPALCSILLLLQQTPAWSANNRESLRFTQFTVEDGLTQNSASSIVQDQYGFIWIGGESGLNRYDGHDFRTFTHVPGDPNSLPNNNIRALEVDREGYLWIGTAGGGLARYDHRTENFSRFTTDPGHPDSLNHDRIWDFLPMPDGKMWIATRGGGINIYDPNTGKFSHIQHDPNDVNSLSDDRTLSLFQDSRGFIWIGTENGGLNKYNPRTRSFRAYRNKPGDPTSISSNGVLPVAEDRDGMLWVGTIYAGLNHFNPRTGLFVRYAHDPQDPGSISHEFPRSLAIDSQGTLWVSSYSKGLDRYNRETKTFENFGADQPDDNYLPANLILSMYEDRSGLLWIGTSQVGVLNINLYPKSFHSLTKGDISSGGLEHQFISTVYRDSRNDLWVGTGAGLHQFVDLDSIPNVYTRNDFGEGRINDDVVWTIIESRNGLYWVGTQGGLSTFDPETKIFSIFPPDSLESNITSAWIVRDLYQDTRDNIWIATETNGLFLFNQKESTISELKFHEEEQEAEIRAAIYNILESSDGNLWLATREGIIVLDLQTLEWTRMRSSDRTGLLSDYFLCLHETADSTIWAGSYGGGLSRYHRETSTFTTYSEADGLPDNTINSILEDNSGQIWISSNRGLSLFDPHSEMFRSFTRSDGLASLEFNAGVSHQDYDGTMFFGGHSGLAYFHPDSIDIETKPPQVVLTDLLILNERVNVNQEVEGHIPLPKAIISLEEITLTHRHRVLSFGYTVLNMISPEKCEYSYKMHGFDDRWNDVGTRRLATYTNVPPGTYEFQIRASNSDGTWNNEGARIKLHILPPFWMTWWFRIVTVLIVVGGTIAIYRTQTGALRKRQAVLEHMNRTLREEMERRQYAQRLNQAAYQISQAVDESFTLGELYAKVHSIVHSVMTADHFFIALVTDDTGKLEYVYTRGELEDITTMEVPENGITRYIFNTEKSLFATVDDLRAMAFRGEFELVGNTCEVVLGVPLILSGKRIGVIVLQHYTDRDAYSNSDMRLLEFMSSQIARSFDKKRSERALEDSLRRFSETVNSLPIVVFETDLHGHLTFLNDTGAELLGVTPAMVESNFNIFDLVVREESVKVRKQALRLARGVPMKEAEFTAKTRSGRQISMLLEVVGLNTNNRLTGARGIAVDISDRKLAQERVRQSEERFRNAFENAPIGVALISMTGELIQGNNNLATMLGYKQHQLIGKQISKYIHPEDAEVAADLTKNLIADKRVENHLEQRYLHKEGNVIWVMMSTTLQRNSDHEPEFFISQFLDITEQKLMENALRESEKLYRSIVETLNEGFAIFDESGRFSYVNPKLCDMLLQHEDEILSTKLSDHCPKTDRKIISSSIGADMKQEPEPFDVELFTSKEERLNVRISPSPIHDVHGSYKGSFAVIMNTTEQIQMQRNREELHQKELETERKRAEAIRLTEQTARLGSIGVMAGGITHEINQPLNAISVNAQTIQYLHEEKNPELPGNVYSLIQRITEGAERIDKIIKHMRSFWLSKTPTNQDEFDLQNPVRSALLMSSRQLKSHGVVLESTFPDDKIFVKGNMLHVEQIVLNLLNNAMRALDGSTRTDKWIHVESRIEDNSAVLLVHDNGSGFENEPGAEIFDPFYSTGTSTEGTGLGLAIVKTFVDQFKGEVHAENNQWGGASFVIRLPLVSMKREKGKKKTVDTV